MPADPLDPRSVPTRRRFLQAGAAGALICTIGGQRVTLAHAGDAAKADAVAAAVPKPAAATPEATEQQTYVTPQPQPGGRQVEYWVRAVTTHWTIVPTGHDDWMDMAITGKSRFKAVVYQRMTAGFAAPAGPAQMPGPTLYAEVGDTLVVHFRNELTDLKQAVTMHPHGVKYNPDYDGSYLGRYTRAGGYIAPGEEFTYTWECMPESVGAWPYHDHGPNHSLNTFRGMFGALIVRVKDDPAPPDVEQVLFMHSLQPPVTGLRRAYECFNGRAYAGNTPTLRASPGQDVALHVFGMDNDFHDFHIHGHRWKDSSGTIVDTPTVGPAQTTTIRFVEDNLGRWLYHCHVISHQDMGMAGWYLVE